MEWSFRGIAFPASGHTISGGQSHTSHQAMDRDGALVETTGRESDRFEVNAVFDNGLVRSESETWADLYPNTYLKFLDALRDRSTGELTHPLRGPVKVKAIAWEEKIDPSRRSGVTLSVTFLETKDENEEDESLFEASPLAFAEAEAVMLDAELGALNPPLPTDLPEGTDLGDLVGDIKGAIGSVGLAAMQVAGKINGAVAGVTSVIDTVERTGDQIGSAAGSIADNANRLLDGLNRMKGHAEDVLKRDKPTGVKINPADWTWSQAVKDTGNTLDNLTNLNPHLGGKSVIPSGSAIKFYKK